MWERCCMVQHSSLRAIFTGFRAREHHSQYCSWEKYGTICCLEKWQLSSCVNCERHWVFDLGKENAREEMLRQSRALRFASEQFDYTNVTRDPFQTYSCQKSRSFSLTKSTQELWCSILVLHFSQSFSTQSCLISMYCATLAKKELQTLLIGSSIVTGGLFLYQQVLPPSPWGL